MKFSTHKWHGCLFVESLFANKYVLPIYWKFPEFKMHYYLFVTNSHILINFYFICWKLVCYQDYCYQIVESWPFVYNIVIYLLNFGLLPKKLLSIFLNFNMSTILLLSICLKFVFKILIPINFLKVHSSSITLLSICWKQAC